MKSYLENMRQDIAWADTALNLLSLTCDSADVIPAEIESYLTVDWMAHIASMDVKTPLYFTRLQHILSTLRDQTKSKASTTSTGQTSTELNLLLEEYGFIASHSAGTDHSVTDILHGTHRAKTLSQQLTIITKGLQSNGGGDISQRDLLSDLQKILSTYGFLINHVDVTSATDKQRVVFEAEVSEIFRQINVIKAAVLERHFKRDSTMTVKYIAMFQTLRNNFVTSFLPFDGSFAEIINSRVIHPLTRTWLLERVDKWLYGASCRRLYYVLAKKGFGRTALATTIVKLYRHQVVAWHIFGGNKKETSSNHISSLILSLATLIARSLPEYLTYIVDKFGSSNVGAISVKLSEISLNGGASWKENYNLLLRDPLQALYGKSQGDEVVRRKLIVIDSLDECESTEWKDLMTFIQEFTNDTSSQFCLFTTVRSKHAAAILPKLDYVGWEGGRLDDRAWSSQHITDLEIYLSASLGLILSRGEEAKEDVNANLPLSPKRIGGSRSSQGQAESPGSSSHGRVDQAMLEQTIDELVKTSAGRFDWAVELIELLSIEMDASGHQFLGSLKKATSALRLKYSSVEGSGGVSIAGKEEGTFERRIGDFSSAFRAHRDKSGRSVGVQVTSPRQHHQNKSRLPLIVSR